MKKTYELAFWYDRTDIHTVEAFIEVLGSDFIEVIWHTDYADIVYTRD